MKIFLIVLVLIVAGLFVWQMILFIRDLIKVIKKKKAEKNQPANDGNNQADNSAEKGE